MNNFLLFTISALFFILNIGGTIALRNILAISLLVGLFVLYIKSYKDGFSLLNKNILFLYLPLMVLTLYMIVHLFYFSQDFDWSSSEFKSHWIYPIIYLCIGFLLAYVSKNNLYLNDKVLITTIFFALFLHIIYVDLVALDNLLQHNTFISRYGGFTGSPVLANYLTNILMAMILSESIYRVKESQKILQVSNKVLFILFILVIFSSVIEGMRFGVISLLFIGLSSVTLFLIGNIKFSRKHKIVTIVVFMIIVILPFSYNLTNDKRWSSLLETVPLSLNTESNKAWIDNVEYSYPVLSNGEDVSSSNYERMAWAKKSLDYVIEEPMGIGFGRNAFGHFVEKYEGLQNTRGKHSHSSILDFTLGVGVIGLMLWLIFIFYLMFYTLRESIKHNNYYALMSFFLVSGFFFRSLVDSNMRDHMFLQFMLMLGVFTSLMIHFKYEKNSNHSSK